MNSRVKFTILISICSSMSAAAVQRSTPSAPSRSTMSGAAPSFQSQQLTGRLGGFRGRPRVFIFADGGWWWGWPYYGYPMVYDRYGESYEKLGKQWGKELRHGTVTQQQLVGFLQADVLNAADEARSNFQVGFLKGYGKNGLSVLAGALSQAKENQPPAPVINQPEVASPRVETNSPPQKQPGKPPLSAPKYEQ